MNDNKEISDRAGKQIIKKATSKNVSKEAGIQLAKELEEKAAEVAEYAKRLAKLDGRKTVREKDIKQAIKKKL